MSLVLLVAAAGLSAIAVDVKPLTGPPVSGDLVEITTEAVVLQTAAGRQSLPVSSLWEIVPQQTGKPPADPPALWIELTDGSRLLAAQFTVSSGVAAVRLTRGDPLTIPTRTIRWVRLRDYAGQADLAKQWQGILQGKHRGDVVVVRRSGGLDELEGTLFDVGPESVKFEFDGDRIDVNRTKIDGFIYYHPTAEEAPVRHCQVAEVSGSSWQAKSVAVAGERLEVTAATGVKVTLPLAQLLKIDFSAGNATWLSDLEPDSVQWRPYVESRLPEPMLAKLFHPHRDRSVDGQPLLLGGKDYAKGLALTSRTEVVYRLTETYSQLHAVVGIDDRVRDAGNVQLVISGDGKELFSRAITGRDEPLSLKLDVRGVRRLKILFDFGGELDIADHLNLCDARLTK